MLKVEFVRYRNVLCATILEQGEETKRGNFEFEYNGYTLKSIDHIELAYRLLYLNGLMTEKDGLFCSRTYATEELAKEALEGFKEAIKAYNASLLPEQQKATDASLPEQPQTPDVETVIVG